MIRVILKEPDSDRGFQAYQLDVWYHVPGIVSVKAKSADTSVHVWQSNDRYLARRLADPTAIDGVDETVAGQKWHRVLDSRVRGHKVTTFSRRLGEDVTITVDSDSPKLAIEVIGNLAAANKPTP